MAHSNDKHARELKRLAKKKAAAKAAAGDPWTQVPLDDAQLTCVASGDLRLDGQQGILALRRLPGGRCAIASFLVDRGVIGLKSAWGEGQSSVAEFNEMLAEMREDGLPLATVPAEAARQLIAGAARYGDEHGFRLPKDWTRWASLLGTIGEWRTAGTTPFRPEYAESIDYARKHLIGSTVDAFLARADIAFLLPEGDVRPRDPRAGHATIVGETVVPADDDAWVEPSAADYAKLYALLDKRRASITADARVKLAEMGIAPGPTVAEEAVAARAAAAGVARFGRPPAKLVQASESLPNDLDESAADAFYFYRRILQEVLGRDGVSVEARHVMLADCRTIAEFEARSQRRQLTAQNPEGA